MIVFRNYSPRSRGIAGSPRRCVVTGQRRLEANRDRRGAEMDSRNIALNAYRVMAYITGVGLVLLVCVAMPLKYFAGIPQPTAVVGALHGFFYMAYVVCSLVLAERCRWSPLRAVLV